SDRPTDEDLVGAGQGRDARRDDDILAGVVAVGGYRRPRVESDANGRRETIGPAVRSQRTLDSDGSVDRERHVLESNEETVARCFDNPSSVFRNDLAHGAIVPASDSVPCLVADGAQ